MKALRILQSIVSVSVCLAMLAFMSCDGGGGGDPDPQTKQEEVSALMVGKTWKVQSVTVDGVDKSTMFTGLTLAFTNTSVTVTNPGPVWNGVTSWTFTNEDAVAFRRNDNIDVQIEATATSLKLTLPWSKTTLGPGRTSSVSGTHVFTFGL